jgi:hypothetical protein
MAKFKHPSVFSPAALVFAVAINLNSTTGQIQ